MSQTNGLAGILMAGSAPRPFSFVYGGQASAETQKTWSVSTEEKKLDKSCSRRVLTYVDSKSCLQVRCESINYIDYPALEWLVFFRNIGTTDTLLPNGWTGPWIAEFARNGDGRTSVTARMDSLHAARSR